MSELPDVISKWEGLIDRHRRLTGKDVLTDNTKNHNLIMTVPAEVGQHLEDHVGLTNKTYEQVRAYVLANALRWMPSAGSGGLNAVEEDGEITIETASSEIMAIQHHAPNRFRFKDRNPAPRKQTNIQAYKQNSTGKQLTKEANKQPYKQPTKQTIKQTTQQAHTKQNAPPNRQTNK